MWSACVAFPTHLGPRTWHVYRSRRSTSSRNRFSAAELGRGRFRACELHAMSAHLRPHASDRRAGPGARGPVPGAPGPRATGSRVHGVKGPACSRSTELWCARCRRAGARARAQLRAGVGCHVWSSSRGDVGSRAGTSSDGEDPARDATVALTLGEGVLRCAWSSRPWYRTTATPPTRRPGPAARALATWHSRRPDPAPQGRNGATPGA